MVLLSYTVGNVAGQVGGFTWSLDFDWVTLPNRKQISSTHPIKSPTLYHSFAVRKEYFFELGGFDDEMEHEQNLEISLRAWMCGGTVEIVPCSHVGHVFKQLQSRDNLPIHRESIDRSKIRLAEVWLDEYKELFYKLSPDLLGKPCGNMAQLLQLKEKLHCQSFKWYLHKVFPEKETHRDMVAYGYLRNPRTNFCLDILHRDQDLTPAVTVFPCQANSTAQVRLLIT